MSKPRLNMAILGGEAVGRGSLSTWLTHALKLRTHHLAWPNARAWMPMSPDSVLSHFEFDTAARHYTVINYAHFAAPANALPTHAAILDGAVLVVSLPEAVRFQTREHALLAREAGVHRLVVFLDTATGEWERSALDVAESETRAMLAELGYPADDVPVLRGHLASAIGSGGKDDEACGCLDELLAILDTTLALPHRNVDGPFLLTAEEVPYDAIARYRDPDGDDQREVRGWVERGCVRVGDEVELVGVVQLPRTFRIAALEGLSGLVQEGQAGDRLTVRLGNQLVAGKSVPMVRPAPRQGRSPDIPQRPPIGLLVGQVLAAPGSVSPTARFEAECFVPTRQEGGLDNPVVPGSLTLFRIRHRHVHGTLTLPVGVPVAMPGDRVRMEVELNTDVVIEPGMRFTVVGLAEDLDLGDSVPAAFGVVISVLK